MIKLFKYLGLLYCVAAALVLTAFGVHAAIEEFTGNVILPKAHDVYAALLPDDSELRKPLRALRAHVLQVIIGRIEQSSF